MGGSRIGRVESSVGASVGTADNKIQYKFVLFYIIAYNIVFKQNHAKIIRTKYKLS